MSVLRQSEERTDDHHDHKHKDIETRRKLRDEQDMQKIINRVLDNISNPFYPDQIKTLTNSATGVIAPPEVSQDPISTPVIGRKCKMNFLNTVEEKAKHYSFL